MKQRLLAAVLFGAVMVAALAVGVLGVMRGWVGP